MEKTVKLELNRICDGIHLLAIRVIQVVGGFIFLFLTWYALRYTQYMRPDPWGKEIPVNVKDSMIGNILWLIIAFVFFVAIFIIEKKISEKVKKRIMLTSIMLVTVIIGAFGFWWITVIERIPMFDQFNICDAASSFMMGDYTYLQEDQYCGMCPHQLGMVALLEVFLGIVGINNYFACQVVLVLMAAGSVLLGFVLLRQLNQNMAVVLAYCILMLSGIQLVGYTGWIYGDLPSVFLFC